MKPWLRRLSAALLDEVTSEPSSVEVVEETQDQVAEEETAPSVDDNLEDHL